MNKYEAVIIFTEKFNDELARNAIVKYSKILHKYSPKTPIGVDNMGKKRLAYPIREQKDGWYLIFKFNATTENIPNTGSFIYIMLVAQTHAKI